MHRQCAQECCTHLHTGVTGPAVGENDEVISPVFVVAEVVLAAAVCEIDKSAARLVVEGADI